jgi:hypothetical protein
MSAPSAASFILATLAGAIHAVRPQTPAQPVLTARPAQSGTVPAPETWTSESVPEVVLTAAPTPSASVVSATFQKDLAGAEAAAAEAKPAVVNEPGVSAATPPNNGQQSSGNLAFAVRVSDKPSPAAEAPVAVATPAPMAKATAEAPAPVRASEPKAHTESNPGQTVLPQPELRSSTTPDNRPTAAAPPRAAMATLPDESFRPEPIRQISLRIDGPDSQNAQVRVSQRGSEVVVSVRGSDPVVVDSLRGNLPDLAAKLEAHGVKAEVWQPAASTSSDSREHGSERDTARGQAHDHSYSQGQQGQDGRRDRQGRPQWYDEMDEVAPQMPKR